MVNRGQLGNPEDPNKGFGGGSGGYEANLENYLNQNGGYMKMGQSPYQGQYDQLIAQLQQQMTNPQMARNQFKQFNDQGLANQLAMSQGRSPGAARMAMGNMSQMNQGLSQGMTDAATKERYGATQALGGVLGQANQNDFMRSQSNMQAYLEMMKFKMGMPSDWEKLANLGLGAGMVASRFNQGGPSLGHESPHAS